MIEYLINKYNKKFAKEIDWFKLNTKYFETIQEVKKGSKKSIEYYNNINFIKSFAATSVV